MLLILIFILLFKASFSAVTGSGSVVADYGADTNFECKLDSQSGVLQVTWQRLKEGSLENLASYSERFGPDINSPYTEKVIFKQASLSFTSITLRNVTWEDEGCYICSFNVYPEGSQTKQICLTVQGISKVTTSSTQNREEDLFGCSATGKPAPTITWSSGVTNNNQTHTIRNKDNTFTSTSSLILPRPPGGGGYVECVVNLGSNSVKRETIYFSEKEEKKEEQPGSRPWFVWVIVPIVAFSIIVAVICFHIRFKKKMRDQFV